MSAPRFHDALHTYNEEKNLEKFKQAFEDTRQQLLILRYARYAPSDDAHLAVLYKDVESYEKWFQTQGIALAGEKRRLPDDFEVTRLPDDVEVKQEREKRARIETTDTGGGRI